MKPRELVLAVLEEGPSTLPEICVELNPADAHEYRLISTAVNTLKRYGHIIPLKWRLPTERGNVFATVYARPEQAAQLEKYS